MEMAIQRILTREQPKLKCSFDELSSGFEHEESDSYEDDGEYRSDYVPSENFSVSSVGG